MNTANIYDAISGFDEKYVSAADDTDAIRSSFRKNRARTVKITGTVCACAAVVIAAVWIGSQSRFGKTPEATPKSTTIANPNTTAQQGNDPGDNAATDSQHAGNSLMPTEDTTVYDEKPSDINGVIIPSDTSLYNEDFSGNAANGPFQREDDPPIQYRTLVESYGDMEPVKYRWIGPGDHVISKALSEAISEYSDDNVTYRLRLTAYYEPLGRMSPDEQRAFYQAEADRFGLSDKVVFVIESFKDDNTGEEVVTFSAHLYDPSFLDSFPDNPDFGYLIELFGEPSCVK